MSSQSTSFGARFRSRALSTVLAVLIAAGGLFNTNFAVADQSVARAGLISAFCADPFGNQDKLDRIIRARLWSMPSDANKDNVVSEVFDRLLEICGKKAIPAGAENELARFNTVVRDKRVDEIRRPKAEEFREDVLDWVAPQLDFTVEDILDVIRKQATTRQQMVFNLLAEGMTQQEAATRLGVSVGIVNAEKKQIAGLLKSELQITDYDSRVEALRPRAMEPALPAPIAKSEAATDALSKPELQQF